MDQSEIDALMGGGAKGTSPKKGKTSVPAAAKEAASEKVPAKETSDAPAAPPAPTKTKTTPAADQQARLISEIGSVTAVTERETNKVMDKLDEIGQLLDRQKTLITEMMGHEVVQNPAIQSSIQQIMTASADIQNKVFDAMDLMQFQDITRQKLERIIHHLRQIHDYIVDLLGTGFASEQPQKISLSKTIAQTGTIPDENKNHADSVVEQFLRDSKKG